MQIRFDCNLKSKRRCKQWVCMYIVTILALGTIVSQQNGACIHAYKIYVGLDALCRKYAWVSSTSHCFSNSTLQSLGLFCWGVLVQWMVASEKNVRSGLPWMYYYCQDVFGPKAAIKQGLSMADATWCDLRIVVKLLGWDPDSLVCSGQNFPEFQQRQFRDDIGETHASWTGACKSWG